MMEYRRCPQMMLGGAQSWIGDLLLAFDLWSNTGQGILPGGIFAQPARFVLLARIVASDRARFEEARQPGR